LTANEILPLIKERNWLPFAINKLYSALSMDADGLTGNDVRIIMNNGDPLLGRLTYESETNYVVLEFLPGVKYLLHL
jgi:hypothetical protein